MKKGMISLICMLLTLVFIIVALIGPWYSFGNKMSGAGDDYESNTDITLTATTMSIGDEDPETTTHADAKKEYEDAEQDVPDLFGVFDNTLYITIVALIIAILALVGIAGIMFNFGNPKTMKMLGSIFSIITLVIAFVAVFYFMSAFPSEAELKTVEGDDAGFWYSESKSESGVEMSVSYGPGYAWYLMLVGAIFALVAVIFIFMDKPAPAMTQPPQ